MAVSLSVPQARKLVLHSQRLPPGRATGSARAATLAAIEHLGYVQIDTISVVQRAHHHTLWSRNPRYQAAQLDALVAEGQLFEYWSHAAAYLPMRDFRYSLPRKQAIASGVQNHWGQRDKPLMRSILKRIEIEGPLRARDFEHRGKKVGDWNLKPAKRALEYLFMQGDLMAARRERFHKVYDLTERVLPPGTDTSMPDSDEYARFIISRYLTANGLGQAAEMAYLLKDAKKHITATLDEMTAATELLHIRVGDQLYYALPGALDLLNKPLSRSKAKILSPFDNLLIQRKRMQALFDFDYQLECYLPEKKRQYGYFVLPVLWDGRFAGRMDCKADRKNAVLHINHCFIEPGVKDSDTFLRALANELVHFKAFNDCHAIKLGRVSPPSLKGALQAAITETATS